MRGALTVAAGVLAAAGALAAASFQGQEWRDFRHYHIDIHTPAYRAERQADGSLEYREARPEIPRASFTMPKPAGIYRVFLVGGSVAELMARGDTLAAWQARLSSPGRRVEVVDAGSRGYDAWRESLVVDEVLRYSPDAVVFFTGNNEFHDEPLRWPRLAFLAMRLRAVPAFRALHDRAAPAPPDGSRDARFETVVRGSLRRVRSSGVAAVVCLLPNNRAAWAPAGDASDPALSAGLDALDRGNGAGAARAFRAAGPGPLALYLAGKGEELAGRPREAAALYREAAGLEGDARRCPPARNETLRRIAGDEGAAVADLEAAFASVDPLLGAKLFYDGVHWYPEYNSLAAAVVTASLPARPDAAGLAAWRREAARPAFGERDTREHLLRLLLSAAGPNAQPWHAARFQTRGLELVASLDAFRPGTLSRLPGLEAELERTARESAATWWGGRTPDDNARELAALWPHVMRYAGAALRRRGDLDASLAALDAGLARAPGDPALLAERARTAARLEKRARG